MSLLICLTDMHPYFAFDASSNLQPVNVSQLGGQWPLQACNSWGKSLNDSCSEFDVTVVGAFSNAINDCGLYMGGVGGSARYSSNCGYWQDASGWSAAAKEGLGLVLLDVEDRHDDELGPGTAVIVPAQAQE